ncbi:YecA family protein [Salibacterium sp. K-3]
MMRSSTMLFYYGVLHLFDVPEAVNAYLDEDEQMGDYEYFKLIWKAVNEDNMLVLTGEILADIEVSDPYGLKDEHEVRTELPYYPFSKQQLLQAGIEGENTLTPTAADFQDFLKEHYELDIMEVDDITQHMEMMINDDIPMEELIEQFQQWCEIPSDDVRKVVGDQLVHLSNNTRQWVLKGHTPNEVMERERGSNVIPFPGGKRIGRNERCPCGSGKKYKKCCGR